MTQLPGVAGQIEEVIGLEATVALLRARGGTLIEVPTKAAGSDLVKIIGEEALALLIDRFGHGRLHLPMAGLRGRAARDTEAKRRAFEMIDEGASNRQIALKCDISVRTVIKYRREAERDDPQLFLPF